MVSLILIGLGLAIGRPFFYHKIMLVNIFGKRGAGKTHMIKYALQECEAPVVVIDILGNFSSDEIPDSLETESLTEALRKITEYKQYEAASNDERGLMEDIPPIIILRPHDPDEAIDYVSSILWHEEGGTLVIDEADGFNIYNAPCFSDLIRYGRNRNIHLLTGCRRPAELDRNITAGANCIYIFQTQEPRDIDYFAKTIVGKEQAERLKNMPDYHGLFINYDKKTIGVFRTDDQGAVWILSEKSLNNRNDSIEI